MRLDGVGHGTSQCEHRHLYIDMRYEWKSLLGLYGAESVKVLGEIFNC